MTFGGVERVFATETVEEFEAERLGLEKVLQPRTW
jgi:hypothetical protein